MAFQYPILSSRENSIMSFSSERAFRLWDYNVSHNQLLLRSPRGPDVATNIDVVFWGVEYLAIASALHGIAMIPCGVEDRAKVEDALGKSCDPASLYCLQSESRRFVVYAAGFKVLENTLDIFSSSLEYFAATDSSRDLGAVLAHS
jgi:hypothetical protein